MKNIVYLLFILSLVTWSCNEDEPIPSYVYIQPYQFDIDTQSMGTADSKIPDVWLSVALGAQFIGHYELPALVPLLYEGETTLILDPVIKANGINSTPNFYPFMGRYTVTPELTQGEIDTIQPVLSYGSEVTFSLIEGFDNSNNSLTVDLDDDEDSKVVLNTTSPFEGDASAELTVTTDHPQLIVASENRLTDLPSDGRAEVYLEVNYKCEHNLIIGLVGYSSGASNPFPNAIITLNPRETWNKIYIRLTDEIIFSGFEEYALLFGVDLPSGESSSTAMVDNIKVVHNKQ